MRNILTITKFEFFRYFSSPLAYIYLIAFLILNASFSFYFGNLIERGQADLVPMFTYLPWLYLMFISGISMRLWAEEFKSKTIFQMTSLPVKISGFVWGKFFAAWAFCGLALLLTTPLWISINFLASPDNSTILVGYLAGLLLSGAMIAIAQTMSALTQNQVVALVLAVIMNLIFFLSGLEFVLGFLRAILPISIIEMIASFSFISHFYLLSQGLVELKTIIFFVAVIALFNSATIIVVSFKTSGTSKWLQSKNKNYYIAVFALALIGFCGINLIASKLFATTYFDATADHRFSLSQSTKNTLKNLKEPIHAKLYFSPILAEKNPMFRDMFNDVKIKLKQYQRISKNKFTYSILYPQTLGETEDLAISAGLQALPILDSNQAGFFGLVMTDTLDHKQVIEFFAPQRKDFLEQELSEKIYLMNIRKKKLGLITGLPLYEQHIGTVVSQKWEVINQLEKFYNIEQIDNKNPKIEDIDALVIIAPDEMSEDLVANIKNYKNKGGKFLILLDMAPEAIRNFAPSTKKLAANNFSGLEKEFGFEFYPNIVVADLDNSLSVDASMNYATNPIITQDVMQFVLKQPNFNQKADIVKGLKRILLSSASIINPDKEQKTSTFFPLLKASPNSALMSSEYIYSNINPAQILADFHKDDFVKILAAKLVGTEVPFEAIVIGDSDFIYDSFWTEPFNIMDKSYNITLMDNINFILNSLDDLLNNNDLFSLRGKSSTDYRLTLLENIRKESQLTFKVEEQKVLEKINQAKIGIQEILSKKSFENRQTFVPDELAALAKLRKHLTTLKLELGAIKDNSYNRLNNIENTIKFINIYAVAIVLLLVLLAQMWQQNKYTHSEKIKINNSIKYFAIICLGLLLVGIKLNLEERQSSQIDKPVFSKLDTEVNDIEIIKLSNKDKTLEFYKEDRAWKLKGYEDFVVYNARIRSLLNALISARFYEQKSDKIKNLSIFELRPIDNKNSTASRIELITKDGKVLEDFLIGKYDIDLGRGARGAYFRENKNFDVWLILADLIDISPNWQDFVYSSLWNLRFGQAIDEKAETIRDMINTKFISAQKDLNNPTKLFSFNIKTTEQNITIDIFKTNDKYWARYNLAEFNNIYYEISKQDMEKLQNVK